MTAGRMGNQDGEVIFSERRRITFFLSLEEKNILEKNDYRNSGKVTLIS